MRKNTLVITAVFLLVISALIMAQPKPRVAVMAFQEEFDRSWWVSGKMGEKASSLFAQAMWDTKKFQLIERKEIETILKEHNLSASGAVTVETAVKLGKLLGADYMVLGAVVEFGWDKYGGRIGRFNVGGTVYNYNSTINVRIVNVETSEIVFMGSGSGSHRTGAVGLEGYSAGAESSYDSVAGETFKPAVEKIAEKLREDIGSLITYQGFGRVADVDEGDVFINRGSKDGVKVGDTYDVYHLGKAIKDPDTGKVLSRRKKKTATVKVISVESASLAICEIVTGKVEAGDLIEK